MLLENFLTFFFITNKLKNFYKILILCRNFYFFLQWYTLIPSKYHFNIIKGNHLRSNIPANYIEDPCLIQSPVLSQMLLRSIHSGRDVISVKCYYYSHAYFQQWQALHYGRTGISLQGSNIKKNLGIKFIKDYLLIFLYI